MDLRSRDKPDSQQEIVVAEIHSDPPATITEAQPPAPPTKKPAPNKTKTKTLDMVNLDETEHQVLPPPRQATARQASKGMEQKLFRD